MRKIISCYCCGVGDYESVQVGEMLLLRMDNEKVQPCQWELISNIKRAAILSYRVKLTPSKITKNLEVMSMGSLDVTFIVRDTGEKVIKHFDHPDPCWRFICRAKHSKRICLVSYPNFSY